MAEWNPGLVFASIVMGIAVVGVAVTLAVAIVMDRRDRVRAEAYWCGWYEGALDALRTHGPSTDHPEDRLRWLVRIQPREENPYGDGLTLDEVLGDEVSS